MKGKLFSIALSAMLTLSFIFVACNNRTTEEVTPNQTATKQNNRQNKSSSAILSQDVRGYIQSFYGSSNYTIGRQVTTIDNGQTILVSEVVFGTARGYMVSDASGQTPLHFADVDRSAYTLTSVDIVANDTEVTQNINLLPDYSSTDEFDFIKIVEETNSVGGFEASKPKKPVFGWCEWELVRAFEGGWIKERRKRYFLGICVKTEYRNRKLH